MADNGGFLKGFILGGLIGGFAALVLAPKTGKEFREELGEESEKFLNKTKKDFEHAKKAAAQSYESGRDKFMNKMVENDENDESLETEVPEAPIEKEIPKKTKSRKKSTTTKSNE